MFIVMSSATYAEFHPLDSTGTKPPSENCLLHMAMYIVPLCQIVNIFRRYEVSLYWEQYSEEYEILATLFMTDDI